MEQLAAVVLAMDSSASLEVRGDEESDDFLVGGYGDINGFSCYMDDSPDRPWEEQFDRLDGVDGVNNMNTLPLANIPYKNINSIGKQWIRRYALALSKETLGQVRSKFGNTIPIPGESVNLNGDALLSQAKDEQQALREELIKVLDELTYTKLAEDDKNFVENAAGLQKAIPLTIFVG